MFKKLLLATTVVMFASPALAEWPEKAIEFVIPFGAGGGADIEGRLIAKGMSDVLGVPVVPINKPGAGGAVTYTYVKDAKPDGYKLAWNSLSILTTTNIGNVPFDYTALDHVARSHFQPLAFYVNASSDWKTMGDLVEYCKANPNKVKIGHHGTGSSSHLVAVVMQKMTGCQATLLPLKGNAPLLSGEINVMSDVLTGGIKLWEAGKFRILTHFTAERNAVIPDVPTMKELGYDVAIEHFRGISVPKGTPDAVKAKIADAIIKAANSKAFTDLAKNKGFTVAPTGAAEFEKMLAERNELVANIMKDAGIYRSKKPKN
ncbi:MAG: tripartite tricarboxylate transporter substrate binding protein [Sulfitobacter sp. SK025]|nr:MAG: tripartite tricarboxylate transporter substrate binding protein [Sulfitobacter sp. SK025]